MKFHNRMRNVSMLAVALLLAQVAQGWTQHAWAQDVFPSRPIRVVVPFPAGGVLDIAARLVANKLAEGSRYQVVVENRAGGSGHIAAASVKTAPADGYTLLLATNSHLTDSVFQNSGASKLPYDYLGDFTGVAPLVRVPNILVVHKDVPAKTLQELVAAIKKQPGKYNFGSNGRGQPGHLIGLQLKYATNIDLLHVPYRSTPGLYTDLSTGIVQVAVGSRASLLPFLDSGNIRVIATSGERRDPAMPDVPTFAEAGYPTIVGGVWMALVAPKGVPAPILEQLNTLFSTAVQASDLSERWAGLGAEVWPMSTTAFSSWQTAESAKWRTFVADNKINLDDW
jgi:tripartite-type tricarboxylate transporter receptor subunit TctC